MLTLGIPGTSRKENERRLPLHPDQFGLIPAEVRGAIRLERGYAAAFGVDDTRLERLFGGVCERRELLASSDVVLLPKPLPEDLREMREGGILWGWPHCVQQPEITQAAIDRRLTLIAWESMFQWSGSTRGTHAFALNNEMAGYCGVIHALGLTGIDGCYGPRATACVLSHGSVSRGAIHALLGRGFAAVTVYTQRPPWVVHDPIPGCDYGQMVRDGERVLVVEPDGTRRPLVESLAGADVIVNGILQNVDAPLMFLQPGEQRRLRRGALIVDVSCDLGMGFAFARPTSFEQPTFDVDGVTYYAVDHTPSYLWRAATWELSRVVTEFLPDVLGGPRSWAGNQTLLRAIEIRDGVVQNPTILTYQRRRADYPHEPTA